MVISLFLHIGVAMSKEIEKETKLKKVAEGQAAVEALGEALDKDGLLVKLQSEKDKLKDRVKKLEHEVELLKDLVSSALKLKKKARKVLKG